MNINKLSSIDQIKQVLEDSNLELQVILKHSTQCPISSDAYEEYTKFNEKNPNIKCHIIYVIEDRPVSNYVEEITTFRHESPQIIILKDAAPLANFSHRAINLQKLETYI